VPTGSATAVAKKLQVAKGVPKARGDKLSGMWTAEENNIVFNALAEHKRTFPKIHDRLQHTKTREQVRCYYYRVIKKINQELEENEIDPR
jgi:hypothetical protein